MVNQVVLITGANRGIGKGLTEHYLGRNGTTVIAAIRDVTGAGAESLQALPRSEGSELIIVKIDSNSSTDAKEAAARLQSEHQISHVDIAIANAGIFGHPAPVSEWDVSQVQSMMDVNVYGLVHLFQALQPLLHKSPAPKLVYVSSRLGSIQLSAQEALWPGAYGMSKAAGNYVVAKIGAENKWLNVLSVDPGQVQTDMGNGAANMMGLEKAPVTIEQSINGIVQRVENLRQTSQYGVFIDFEGESVPL